MHDDHWALVPNNSAKVKRKDLAAKVIHTNGAAITIAGFVKAADIRSFALAAKTCWLAARGWPQYYAWSQKGPVARHVRLNWASMHERQRDVGSCFDAVEQKSIKSLKVHHATASLDNAKFEQQHHAILRFDPAVTVLVPGQEVLLLLQAQRRLAIAKIHHVRLAERCLLRHLLCEDLSELAAVRSLHPYHEALAARNSSELLMIRQIPFQRLVKEICTDYFVGNMESSAVLVLQDAAETYLKECFSAAARVSMKATPAALQVGQQMADEVAAVRAKNVLSRALSSSQMKTISAITM